MRDLNRVFVVQDGADPREAKVFRKHPLLQGTCEKLVCALELMANSEQSRVEITSELRKLRKFIEVDGEDWRLERGTEQCSRWSGLEVDVAA